MINKTNIMLLYIHSILLDISINNIKIRVYISLINYLQSKFYALHPHHPSPGPADQKPSTRLLGLLQSYGFIGGTATNFSASISASKSAWMVWISGAVSPYKLYVSEASTKREDHKNKRFEVFCQTR